MPDDLLTVLQLVAGVACAAVGGDLFVRGAVSLSQRLRVPAAVIGTTVAAFATSSPELSVSIQAALDGRPELALGDALGSNVINVAFVLGMLFTGRDVVARRAELRRELTVAIVAPILTLIALIDGRLGREEAAVLLVTFVAWLTAITRASLRDRRSSAAEAEALGAPTDRWRTGLSLLGGLALLVLSGRLIVLAAKGLGVRFGLDPFVVGATLVALGTSAPELAAAIAARRRGHLDVGIGTVLGSNVFNNLLIVGVASMTHPMQVEVDEVLLAIGFGIGTLLLVIPDRHDVVSRRRGPLLLGLGAIYLALTVVLGG